MTTLVRSVLAYFEGKVNNNEFVKALKQEVIKVKSNKKWRAEYVKRNVHDPLNFQKGKEEGRQQEKIDMAKIY